MSYFKNFVGFKSRSNGTSISVSNAVQTYDSYARQGDEGEPGTEKFDSDGNSIGINQRGNAKTERWGDTEGYQVGNTYTKLEGDAVVDVVGNSSAKRTGWVNNVTFGPTFATQIGGTFATSLFTVNTLIGFRCSIFGGIDVACSKGPTVKIKLGEYIFNTKPTFETEATAKVAAGLKDTQMWTQVNRLIGTAVDTYATNFATIAGGAVTTMCTSQSTTCAAGYLLAAQNISIVGPAAVSVVSSAKVNVGGLAISLNAGLVTIGGGLIKLG